MSKKKSHSRKIRRLKQQSKMKPLAREKFQVRDAGQATRGALLLPGDAAGRITIISHACS
jgi:hypothetical protein